jgi:hypothetical protein
VTSQEPITQPSADTDAPETQVIIAPLAPAPVFVDSTGRRRRTLRRVSYAFGALVMLYAGLVSVSLAGGPVSSSAVLGIPDLADGSVTGTGVDGDDRVTRPSPISTPSRATPRPVFVADQLPQRGDLTAHAGGRTAAPPRSPATRPKPSKSPSPRASATKKVESTTVPSAPSSSTPTPSTSASAPVPAPPGGSSGSGGSGGSSDTGGVGGGSVMTDGSAVDGSSAGGPAGSSGSAGGGGSASGGETVAEDAVETSTADGALSAEEAEENAADVSGEGTAQPAGESAGVTA